MDEPVNLEHVDALLPELEAMAKAMLRRLGCRSRVEPDDLVQESLLQLKGERNSHECVWPSHSSFRAAAHVAMVKSLNNVRKRSEGRDNASKTPTRPDQTTALTPELCEWLLSQSSEEEIVSGLQELREKGGFELRQFIDELEQVVRHSERTE